MTETLKKLLLQKLDFEPSDEMLERMENECVFCEENVMSTCGTPVVRWGGCCVGWMTPEQKIMTSRKAHVRCFLYHLEREELIKTLFDEET